MAATIPVGSDVSSGAYKCTSCGYEMGVQSVVSLPPCPKCPKCDGRTAERR